MRNYSPPSNRTWELSRSCFSCLRSEQDHSGQILGSMAILNGPKSVHFSSNSLPKVAIIWALSGPVLRDTARLSQRCPLLRAMRFLVSQHGQLGAIPPPPFLSVSPLESMRSGGAIPPPQKGYLSDTFAIPYENKANGCDTPLCDTISKRYCAIWGGISHWAAKFGLVQGTAEVGPKPPRAQNRPNRVGNARKFDIFYLLQAGLTSGTHGA